jgi:hypothetical protein
MIPRRPIMMNDIERRLRRHFADDDVSDDILHELATIVEAVVGERLADRARQGGLARAANLTPARRREIARRANRARRTP